MLYDGWPLVYDPGSPPALHLLELLAARPAAVDAWLALPGEAQIPLDADIHLLTVSARANAAGRMIWEQAHLAGLVRQCQAQLLHTTGTRLPLASPVPGLVSPAEGFRQKSAVWSAGLAGRLRDSFGRGGLSNGLVLWPEDLPPPEVLVPWMALPVSVHPQFCAEQGHRADLPETYVLAPGPLEKEGVAFLAAAWRWAAAGLGEECALITMDLTAEALQDLRGRCQTAEIPNVVEAASVQSVEDRAALFQQAGAVLLASPVLPWGDAFAQALACGCRIAAEETPWSDARVGPGGYLVPHGDARALGAALITMMVEAPVAEQLGQSARQRAVGWQSESFTARLAEVYEKAASFSA